MISPSQRPLPDKTQHSQQTNIHSHGGIRTHDRSRRAAVDLRVRRRGYWDWRMVMLWCFNYMPVVARANEPHFASRLMTRHITLICNGAQELDRCIAVLLLGPWASLYVCIRECIVYARRSFGKYRTFFHTEIFIDNRKETEYGFITHLHLLLHFLDNEALVVP